MVILVIAAISALSAVTAAALTGGGLLRILWVFLAVYAGLHLLFAVVYFIASLFVKKDRPIVREAGAFWWFCGWAIASAACAYGGVHATVRGREKIPVPGESRFVMVSNHRSNFDPLVVFAFLTEYHIAFISKPSNFNIPVAGSAGHMTGCVPIDRENDRNALRSILAAADYVKKDYCSMFVYPEGTRSKTGELLPFHAGSFKLAQKAKVPLVICATSGTENGKRFGRKEVFFDVLETVPADRVAEMSTQELSEHARRLISEHLEHSGK